MAGKTGEQLTPRMMHFARCVASGQSQSDAYREAYNVGEKTKPATVHVKASAMMARVKVRARVDALVSQRDKASMRSSVDLRSKVLKKLEDFSDSAEPADNVRLRATELLGKSIGLFKDVIDDSRTGVRTSDELQDELRAKLDILLSEDNPTIQ